MQRRPRRVPRTRPTSTETCSLAVQLPSSRSQRMVRALPRCSSCPTRRVCRECTVRPGISLEQALYSTYGKQTIVSGSDVTPFGFQGSYTDSTGLIYLINRYYDPTTDQFLSVDPAVAQTDQPYAFVNDDPLTWSDPLGLRLAGEGTESCGGSAKHLTCTGASPNGVSVAGTINTKSTKSTIIVGTTKVTVSTSVTVATRGSSRSPTVNIDSSGSASVTLPGYVPITASSSGAVGAALGNNSGASVSISTDGVTYTDSIPSATIGGVQCEWKHFCVRHFRR